MPTPFAKTFVRLRREAGFETAYQFFHKNGGAKTFRCSFPNYLRIEKGSHLPQPQRLPLLCSLLRLPLKADEMRHLLCSYLETWVGTKDLADWFLGHLSSASEPAPPLAPAEQALRRVTRETARTISVKQYEAIMESAESYWCYRVLTTSKDPYRPEDLGKLLKLKTGPIAEALEGLRRYRIIVKERNGGYRSPLSGEFILFPDSQHIDPEIMKRVFKYNSDMIKKRGKVIDVRYCGIRADLRKLQGFIPHFRESIRSVNAYALNDKTDHSALVFVEGKIVKLFDF